MAMSLQALLEEIGESACAEFVEPHWNDSIACLPNGEIPALTAEQIRRNRARAGIDEGVESALLSAASRILASASLRALFWHAARSCFDYQDISWFALARWPSLEHALGPDASLFYLLVGLDMVPRTIAKHRELGIPEEVTRQTLVGPRAFLRRFEDGNGGRPGIFRREVGWLRHTTDGELFRLGRFEYMHRLFREPYHAYRNDESGAVVLLAADGSRFTADGFADPRPADGDPGWWEARRVVDDSVVRGYAIAPYGRAIRREVTLDLRTWREVVTPGATFILDVHIPVGGRMTPEAIGDSFREAVAFFRTTFPEKSFAGFRCASWILGPQLEEIFPPTANLVRFLREIYLYPLPSSPYDGFFFIYADPTLNEDSIDGHRLASLPERTSLQRRVKEHLMAGRPWRGGGMLFLAEDLEHFGTSYYRANWPGELVEE